MSRIMIVVEFEVRAPHRDEFIALLTGHAERSRAEDGCEQFDVLLPHEDGGRIFLVEAWRDRQALESHGKEPRMARLRETYAPWIASRRAVRCTPA